MNKKLSRKQGCFFSRERTSKEKSHSTGNCDGFSGCGGRTRLTGSSPGQQGGSSESKHSAVKFHRCLCLLIIKHAGA